MMSWNERYRPFVWGIRRSPVNSPHTGQWRGALVFSLICGWIKCSVNNRGAGDLRHDRAHDDVIEMPCSIQRIHTYYHIEAETKWPSFSRRNFQMHFLEWKHIIAILLKFVPNGSISNIPALVQIMVWRRPGDMPSSEPMLVSLLPHTCVTRPRWVDRLAICGI